MNFIQTILTEGFNQIILDLKMMPKTMSRAEDFCIIRDELDLLNDSPVEYIEDMIGYAEELKDEPIKDLSPLQRAIARLYFEKGNTRKFLDRDLLARVKDSAEYYELLNIIE